MPTPNGHRIIDNADIYLRDLEKGITRQQRRPNITKASDLMGPGLGPRAVQINNWRGEETMFNGFYYSAPGAIDAPDTTSWWMGETICQLEGYGIQRVYDYRGTSSPMTVKTRRIGLSGGLRVFGAWA